jgi:hypothetical protein
MNATHSLAEPAYKYIADHNDVFDRVVAYSANNDRSNIGLNGKADVATVQPVSGDFFDGMGIAPAARLARQLTTGLPGVEESVARPPWALSRLDQSLIV